MDAFFKPWPHTDDGFIPYDLFRLLYQDITHVQAEETLNHVRAVSQAIGQSFAGEDDTDVVDTLIKLRRTAFPDIEENGYGKS